MKEGCFTGPDTNGAKGILGTQIPKPDTSRPGGVTREGGGVSREDRASYHHLPVPCEGLMCPLIICLIVPSATDWGASPTGIYFLTVLEARSPRSRRLLSPEASLRGLQVAVFLLCLLPAFSLAPLSSSQDTSSARLGSPHMTSLNLNYFFKDPIFKCHILTSTYKQN